MGFRFYYWPKYKELDELPVTYYGQIRDHSGYKISELFVEKRYETFGAEIMNYKYITMSIKALLHKMCTCQIRQTIRNN